MNNCEKHPLDPENATRPATRYHISVAPGTYLERVSAAGLEINQWWADSFDVEPALHGEFWAYTYRHPLGFGVSEITTMLATFNLAPARVEHLLGFAACFPDEAAHYPLVALGTRRIVRFVADWYLPVFPALKTSRRMGAVGLDYKEYNKYDYDWMDEDVTLLCVRKDA